MKPSRRSSGRHKTLVGLAFRLYYLLLTTTTTGTSRRSSPIGRSGYCRRVKVGPWQRPSSPPAPPQGAPGGSGGRAWRLWAARRSQEEAGPLGASHCLECSS
eukprot:scaffold68001_cov59-Phaeocystis_antarctica.AAC.5